MPQRAATTARWTPPPRCIRKPTTLSTTSSKRSCSSRRSRSTGCAGSTDPMRLADQLKGGLDAPICLTWELTYACNLACVHCLSSSGQRDPRELTTAEAVQFLDEL